MSKKKKIQISQILINNKPAEFTAAKTNGGKYYLVQNIDLNLVSCQSTIKMCIKELISEARFSKKYYAKTDFLPGSLGAKLKELYKQVSILRRPTSTA